MYTTISVNVNIYIIIYIYVYIYIIIYISIFISMWMDVNLQSEMYYQCSICVVSTEFTQLAGWRLTALTTCTAVQSVQTRTLQKILPTFSQSSSHIVTWRDVTCVDAPFAFRNTYMYNTCIYIYIHNVCIYCIYNPLLYHPLHNPKQPRLLFSVLKSC